MFDRTPPDRLRVVYVDAAGHVLGPASGDPPAGAVAVRAYALTAGQHGEPMPRGYVGGSRGLPLARLPRLDAYWAEPLRELNERGRQVAQSPRPDPLLGETFRVGGEVQNFRDSPTALAAHKAAASALGISKSDFYRWAATRAAEAVLGQIEGTAHG